MRLNLHLLLHDLGVHLVDLALGVLILLLLVLVIFIDGLLSSSCQLSTLQVAVLEFAPLLRHTLNQKNFKVGIS